MVNDFLQLGQSSAGDVRRWTAQHDSAKIYLHQMPALTLMDRLRIPVLAVDSIGTIGYANNAFTAMLGYHEAAQFSGLRVSDIASEQQFANALEKAEKFSSRDGWTITWRHTAGHPVETVVWPVIRLRVFSPLTVIVLTEAGAPATGTAS